jgi:hypothetical protein
MSIPITPMMQNTITAVPHVTDANLSWCQSDVCARDLSDGPGWRSNAR